MAQSSPWFTPALWWTLHYSVHKGGLSVCLYISLCLLASSHKNYWSHFHDYIFAQRSHRSWWCASGCVVECRTCNREVAGSNLGLGYFAPSSTQPSIPPMSVNEYQLWQVWLIPLVDETQDVPVNLWYPSTLRAIPKRLIDFSWRYTNRHYRYIYHYFGNHPSESRSRYFKRNCTIAVYCTLAVLKDPRGLSRRPIY